MRSSCCVRRLLKKQALVHERSRFRSKRGGAPVSVAGFTHGKRSSRAVRSVSSAAGAGTSAARGCEHLGGLGSAKLANFCKFLAGSFSAVSKQNFARKYAFDSICQALQDLHTFAPLQSQFFSQKINWKNQQFSVKIQEKVCK